MTSERLLLFSESGLQTRIFFRAKVGAFFTLVLPLMFLVMINLFFGDEGDAGQYITASLAVFGMVTATFTNLAIGTSIARDDGVLKRVAGTPMPMWVHLGGRILSASVVGVISVALMLTVGWAFFGVDILWSRMPLFALLLLAGAVTFSALGLGVAAITPSAKAAPAIANFVILPLAFISGVFFPMESAPEWLKTVAGLLPLEPLATAAIDVFASPQQPDFPWSAFIKLAIWASIGLALALRFFSYEPAGSGEKLETVGSGQPPTEMET